MCFLQLYCAEPLFLSPPSNLPGVCVCVCVCKSFGFSKKVATHIGGREEEEEKKKSFVSVFSISRQHSIGPAFLFLSFSNESNNLRIFFFIFQFYFIYLFYFIFFIFKTCFSSWFFFLFSSRGGELLSSSSTAHPSISIYWKLGYLSPLFDVVCVSIGKYFSKTKQQQKNRKWRCPVPGF